jgi:hypothetical protein
LLIFVFILVNSKINIDSIVFYQDCITAAVEALAKQENKNNMGGNGGGKSSGKSKSKKNNQVTKVVYVKRVRPGQGFRAG